ncbi:MAG: pyridoxamine 5'-phosphate oxidase family protein [Candidatus Hermodarchaeota archaeon]
MRKQTFGILCTADQDGKPHAVGMLYGVSPPKTKFSIYMMTLKGLKKARNIEQNPQVAIVIPFPHHIIRFAPSNIIQFQGNAELIPFDDSEAQKVFKSNRILKTNLNQARYFDNPNEKLIFIKITPNTKINCYGLGVSLLKIKKEHWKSQRTPI